MVEESLGGAKPEVSSSSRPLENQSLTEAKIKPAEGVISVRNKQMAENGVKCEKATLVMIPPGPSALREGAGSGVLGRWVALHQERASHREPLSRLSFGVMVTALRGGVKVSSHCDWATVEVRQGQILRSGLIERKTLRVVLRVQAIHPCELCQHSAGWKADRRRRRSWVVWPSSVSAGVW
ncbi:hypothetical protein QC764_117323 [Podospora pseudoanserina]|uniref:Uncharacterized protein n=1 Tax=Podospora pseudoanserina TaxID=2609844 RepID=A0ABR0IQD6_9PEZI|nr:hypothetical protein QC764_117323 [Podospora pseudoanserina]